LPSKLRKVIELPASERILQMEREAAKESRVDIDKLRGLENMETLSGLSGIRTFKPGMLINAVGLQQTVSVFDEAAPYIPGDCIVADVVSIKAEVIPYYERCPFRFVSVHPMFGPTFADMASLKEESAIIIKESDREGARFFQGIFERLGVRVVEYSFSQHDEMMACALTLPFLSSMAFAACIDGHGIPGTTFAKHVNIAGGLLSEDDHLIAEILFNPHSISELEKVTAKLEYLKHIIRDRDKEELEFYLQRLRKNLA